MNRNNLKNYHTELTKNKMKQSQEKFVIEQLKLNGFISRNFCLENYVSRLSAIIQDLEADGWKFEPKYIPNKNGKGRNYVYYVVGSPLKKLTYTVDGKEIIIYK